MNIQKLTTAENVIAESKCVEKRKVDNRLLILNIKLIGD